MELKYSEESYLRYNVNDGFTAAAGTPGYVMREKRQQTSDHLDKYNGLLLSQRQLHSIPPANVECVNTIWDFVHSLKAHTPNWCKHPENTVYAVHSDGRKSVQNDFVSINPQWDSDTLNPFTLWFTATLIQLGFYGWWDRTCNFRDWPQMPVDEETAFSVQTRGPRASLYFVASVLKVVVASKLPSGSIVILYFIGSSLWRLIFIVGSGILLATILKIFAAASSPEIFAVTVALASVQVVFVGTAFGVSGSS
ncbi:hypothetical protein B0A55_02011 [Friedmanniomyces simplex]|uniref:DUF6594 domain-containing protein n=1 Tax=Friedmanniomyces simplex TaxID=329884 RepID=A0A4U0XSH5_9PEZI|nr:hypothetical protein B0A55_02011 [Friedmanniomyces simplex]